MTRVTGT